MLSPKQHPNAFAAGTSGALTAFLVNEAKTRLGVDITVDEAGMIVAAAAALYVFLGRKFSV